MNISNITPRNWSAFMLTPLFIFIALSTDAQNHWTWDGSESSDWFNSANWEEGSVPTVGADVNIAVSDHYPVIDDIAVFLRNLSIAGGATFTIDADPDLGVLVVNSIFIGTDGTLVNRGKINLWQDQGDVGNIAIASKGTIDNATVGNIIPESGLITITSFLGTAIINQGTISNSARIEITGTERNGIQNGSSTGGPGIITNSGTISIKNTVDYGLYQLQPVDDNTSTFTNSGTLTIDGSGYEGILNHSILKNTSSGEILIGQDNEVSMAREGWDNSGTFSEVENDGLIKIDNCPASSGLICRSESSFTNENGGQILIGQSAGTQIGGHGITTIGATFINDNSEIIVDEVNDLQTNQYGLNINSTDFQNLNNGQITIGTTNAAGDGPGFNCNNSTITNDNSTINVLFTNGTGFSIVNGGFLLNIEGGEINIGTDGGIEGIGMHMASSSLTNSDNSIIRIDNAAYTGLNIDGDCTFINENTAHFYIGHLGPVGTSFNDNFDAIKIQNSNNSILNDDCAQMFIHKQIDFGPLPNNFTNFGILYIESEDAHQGPAGVINHGIVTHIYDNSLPNSVNYDLILDALVLDGCIINNAIDLGASNDYSVGDTWYGDPQKTEVMGYYDSNDNTFTVVNLPDESPATLYYDVTDGNCSWLGKVGLVIEDYANGVSTWTGIQSDNWHSSCNWDPEVIPGTSSNIEIPATGNNPKISSEVDAFGKSVYIEAGASLTIEASNTLIISGTTLITNIGFDNYGTFTNNGVLIIKDSESNLLENNNTFVNGASGTIQLYNSVNGGLTQGNGGSFTNNGIIDIDQIGTIAINAVSGLIENNSAITIGYNVDFLIATGIDISGSGTFTNGTNGSLLMKNFQSGIKNLFGTLNNEGSIEIDKTTSSAIWGLLATINNNGSFKIGMNGEADNIDFYGILFNNLTFNNLENGILEIGNTVLQTIRFDSGVFENYGNVYSHGQIFIGPSKTLTLKSGRFEVLNE